MLFKVPKHKYLLALCDYSLLLTSFFIAVKLRFYNTPYVAGNTGLNEQILVFGTFTFIWIAIFQHFHLYKINIFLTILEQIVAVVKAIGYGVVGLIIVSFFVKGLSFFDSRLVIAYFFVMSVSSIIFFRTMIFRNIFLYAAEKKILQRRILIIGTDRNARLIAAKLITDTTLGLHIVGFIDDQSKIGERVFEDAHVIGSLSQMKSLVEQHHIDEVIIAANNISHQQLIDIIDQAKLTTAIVKISSELYGIVPDKVWIEQYVDIPMISMMQNHKNTLFIFYKRLLDILFSIIGIVVLSIPFAIIAFIIRLTSKGPVFFSQSRIGKDGKPFAFYKFRSMYIDNDDTAHREFTKKLIRESKSSEAMITSDGKLQVKKITNDPRVTAIGRFLRKTSIDELPQLFNVLKGDMSLVGPRPCLPYEWEEYEMWHRRRLSVVPGCTGLWQVSGRSAVGFNDMVILDLFYIDNMSPVFDFKLIMKTFPVMLFSKGGF
jgi:exopolysaccharide biosynthesis polyprenyl glycosylphosphotransferase